MKKYLALCGVLIITIVVYGNIFANQFAGDDHDFILNWELIRQPNPIAKILVGTVPAGNEGVYRPVRGMLYVGMYKLFGVNPTAYHLFSLLILLTSTVLVYEITKQITGKDKVALISSLIFGLHPVHTESITFMTASFDSFGFMLVFLSVLLYLKHTATGKNIWLRLMWVVSLTAMFTTEFALTTPLLLMLTHLFNQSGFKVIEVAKKLWPLFMGICFYLVLRIGILQIPARGEYLGGSVYLTWLTGIKTIPIYLSLLVWPSVLTLDHVIPPGIYSFFNKNFVSPAVYEQQISEPYVLTGLVLIIVLLGIAWMLRLKKPVVSFGIAWFFISLAPVSNIIPSYTILKEMYLYIASYGYCLLLAYGLLEIIRIFSKKRAAKGFLAAGLLVYGMALGLRTFARNKDWQNDVSLWQATAKNSPANPLVQLQLGNAYQKQGKTEIAREAYRQAIALNPGMAFASYSLAKSYAGEYQTDKAIELYRAAIDADPYTDHYYLDLASAMEFSGNLSTAITTLKQGQQFLPENQEIRMELVRLLNQQAIIAIYGGQDNEAVIIFEQALALVPCSAETMTNYGIYKARFRRYEEAENYLRQALVCEPGFELTLQTLEQLKDKH